MSVEEKSSLDNEKNTNLEVDNIDNNMLSIEELISRVNTLSKDKKPYTVAKEITEIKSIFYSKLKLYTKKKTSKEQPSKNEENLKNDNKKPILHPTEIKFKEAIIKYQKIKSDFRKKQDKEEEVS